MKCLFGHKWELDSLSSAMLSWGVLYPEDLWYYEGYATCKKCNRKKYL